MARRNFTDRLIHISDICEELRLIYGSKTDYITPSGNIYKDYGNDMYYHKKSRINNYNGYLYCGITYPSGNKQRRVHILVAKAYIPNPNNYPIVMHKDDNKTNPNVSNLKWGTISENTRDAFAKGFIKNDKGYDDSQSFPIYVFDLNKNLLYDFGSISMAHEKLDISKNAISSQCKHKTKCTPRSGYYFRYQDEYNKYGFVS